MGIGCKLDFSYKFKKKVKAEPTIEHVEIVTFDKRKHGVVISAGRS